MAADYPEAYAARGEKPITAGGIPVEVENNSGSTAPAPSEKRQPSDTPETDNVHYGCALYESDVERYRDMAEHARSLERQRNEALGRERLANMRADQADEAMDAAREVANRETLSAAYWKDKAVQSGAWPFQAAQSARLEMPTTDEIKLACGEMTAGELRTAKAVLGWFIGRTDKTSNTPKDPKRE
jgi:hypothetical protein